MDAKDSQIIRCTGCGAKNRIPASKAEASAKCGKCGARLQVRTDGAKGYTLRCTRCRAKNRIPAGKVNDAAKCGKCHAELDTRVLSDGSPVMVTDGNFDQTVLSAPLPVVLYCWSAGCPTCQVTGPMMDQFAAEARGRVRVGKLNIEANPQTASRYNVLGVPFLFIFDNGQLKESLPGSVSKHDLMLRMARYL